MQSLLRAPAKLAAAALVVLALALAGTVTVPAWAADLGQAKSAGQVGERTDGYLGLIGSPPGDVRAMVDDINAKRKARYAEIAKKTGASVKNVGLLAGAKAIEMAAPGSYVMDASGAWIKK
ncbi:MAG: YdbL family protein [Hyphomicrobiales bacterium]|nr:YdbL family protein [Hyphomicrobiales bacterium]MCP5372724.1 YdbL family protein [Hyphomicrobiales bacterium]